MQDTSAPPAELSMFRLQALPVSAGALHFASGPKNGPPLIVLHGVGRRWQDFGAVLPTLASRWQVFAVDHRGHGSSGRADRYLVRDYVADAVDFVAGIEQPPVVIGHSLGALTALGVAAARPDKIAAIVLADPPSPAFLSHIEETSYHRLFIAMRDLAGRSRPTAETARLLADVELLDGTRLGQRRDAASLHFLARGLLDLDPAVMTPVIEKRWLDGFDPIAAARLVACPALLLAGQVALGGMLPADDADALVRAFPDGLRVDFDGVGHHLHATRPDIFLQTVVNFLDAI